MVQDLVSRHQCLDLFSLLKMLRLLSLVVLCCWFVPVISSEVCEDLLIEGWTPGQDLTIPQGYSLRDMLTVRGEVKKKASKHLLSFGGQSRQTFMRTALYSNGMFRVFSPSNINILEIRNVVDEDSNKLLLQMTCNETETTCYVTSQVSQTVMSFNYQESMSNLLSSNKILVTKNIVEFVTLQSITFCRSSEPRVEVEMSPSGPVTEGGTYSLICRVTGLPILTATWSRRGDELGNTETEPEESEEEHTLTLTYTIRGLSSEDTGIYKCRGQSLLVSDEGVSGEVNVVLSEQKEIDEIEDNNSGDESTGTDDSEGGDSESGDSEGGDSEGGDSEGGDSESGDSEGGDSEGGDSESGDSEGGDSEGGDSEGGDSESGDSEGGDSEGGDSEGGDSEGGDSEGGDSEGDDSEGGDSEGGDSESGDSESGDSEGGDSESGDSESGDSEDGDSESGDSESGDSDGGDSESGDSESGDSESDDSESGDSEGGDDEGVDFDEDSTQPVCRFLGQNIARQQVLPFPENFSMSDVITVKGDFGTTERGWLFYLYDNEEPETEWKFYYRNTGTLEAWGIYKLGSTPLFDEGTGTIIKLQVFHNISSGTLNIITPKIKKVISKSAYNAQILRFNTVRMEVSSGRQMSYEYISICRPKEPQIVLTTPPQPFKLGSTVTLQCTITGPPFLSGNWSKDSKVLESSNTVLDESEAEHKLKITLVISRFHTAKLGLYQCHATSSILASSQTVEQSVEVTYSAPLNITKPATMTYNLLPTSFIWRVDGYPNGRVGLECTTGTITKSWGKGYTIKETSPRLLNVTVGEGWDGEQFSCTITNKGENLGVYSFSKCQDGSYIEEEECLPCLEGQTSSKANNFTCVQEIEEESGGDDDKEGEQEEEEEDEEEDEEKDKEELDEEEGAGGGLEDNKEPPKVGLSLIIIGGSGVAVFLMATAVVTGIFMKKRRRKRRSRRMTAESNTKRIRSLTVSAPVLHYHISGEVSEVTCSTATKVRTDTMTASSKPPPPQIQKPSRPYPRTAQLSKPSDEEPVYATVNKPRQAPASKNVDDLYSTINKNKEPLYSDAEPLYSEPLPLCVEPDHIEDEAESAYADLEFVKKERAAPGSFVKKVENSGATYATITEFKKIEEGEEEVEEEFW